MTAQGWRKRQTVDQSDTDDHTAARIKVLEAENIDLKILLMHAHYFVNYYGMANTLTEREKQVKAEFLSKINTCLADHLNNTPTGL